MSVTVDLGWSYCGFNVIRLENRYLRLDILPELGANIYNLIYKPKDRNLLWHNPRMALRKAPFGAPYDYNFYGGWDELFPNDPPEIFEGETYPDHGELWCQPWRYSISEQNDRQCTIHLWTDTPVSQARMEKWITLKADDNRVLFHHKLSNLGFRTLHYLWKLHPALEVNIKSRLDLPAKSVEIGPCLGQARGRIGETYQWPFLLSGGEKHDVRLALAPDSQVSEMHYATELEGGWCALTDVRDKLGFGLAFDQKLFSTIWVFMTYGGWRGLNTVILEPSTGYPHKLAEAKTKGRLAHLEAQSSIETEIVSVIYEGFESVGSISSDGQVSVAR